MNYDKLLIGGLLLVVACSDPVSVEQTEPAPVQASAACDGGAPVLPRVGAVVPQRGAGAAAICVAGGADGAEYAVIYSHAVPSAAQQAALVITASGVEPPLFALQSLVGADGAPGGAAVAGGTAAVMAAVGAAAGGHNDGGVHDRVRRLEREELTPLMGAARAWADRAAAAAAADAPLATASPLVGDLMPLNVQSGQACTNADVRTGRVVAISARAIVVADTANPAAGLTAADYASLAASFDTLVVPVVEGNFGTPSDVDGNGKVILFYTRAVNELTPRAADFVVGGFVFGRDLYPRQAAGGVSGCAGSNFAEMFYMLAADPAGTVNGNVRTLEYVRRTTVATLAHEYQHLINAGRRLYVTRASEFEQSWLDEGLSHIAEELVFHRASGLGPLQNLGSQQILASQRRVDGFNRFQTANTGRIESYLKEPFTSSPFAAGNELTTRGAIWNLLRYAADRRGGDQGAHWRRLTAGPSAGTANLMAVFGSDLNGLLADWHVSLLADDAVGGLHPVHTSPSWNLRSVFAMVGRQAFPLRVTPLTGAAPVEVSVAGGGAAYYRFRVAPNGSARLETRAAAGALPAGIVASVVRTR